MKKLLKKLWNWVKKPKKMWIHTAIFAMLSLAVYLLGDYTVVLKAEILKLMAAMLIGAYLHKPLADWTCRKILK